VRHLVKQRSLIYDLGPCSLFRGALKPRYQDCDSDWCVDTLQGLTLCPARLQQLHHFKAFERRPLSTSRQVEQFNSLIEFP
jgi:hypothetical protein